MSADKERLFIKKIEMSNVGRFYGSGHSVMLSSSTEKNITVIIGYSGRGKSTIHDLIYWCLYGEHKKHSEDERRGLDYGLINVDALSNLSKGNSVTASITLTLHNDKEKKYVLTRELIATYNRDSTKREFKPENNSQVQSGIDFESTVRLEMKDVSGQLIPERNPTMIRNEMNKYFPQHLSDFFLFDGENLIKFQNNTSSDFIKNGITKISGLGILGSLSKSAGNTATKISNHLGGKSAEAAPYSSTVKRLTIQAKTLQNEIVEHKTKSDRFRILHDEISEKIRQNKEGSKLVKDEKQTRRNKSNASRDLRETNDQIKDMLFEKIPQLLIRNTLEKSEEIFARLEDEDKIPPSISRGAIDKILGSDPLRCVCGREFEKNQHDPDSPWMILNRIKGTIIEDDLSQGISLGRDLISRIIDNASTEKSGKDYYALIDKRREKTREIQEYNAEIEELTAKMKDLEYEDMENLGTLKQEYMENMLEENGNIRSKQEKLDELESTIKENEKLQNVALEKERIYSTEINKISLANAVSKFSKILEKRIEEIFRDKTEKTTSEYFLQSAPQKEEFDQVNISENYDIAVKDVNNLTAGLSKGQAHVLGLSYVAGIREITHTNTFLIIDSPLHNISGTARNEISEVFSKYLPNVQIVLLVTDTEYLHSDPNGAKPVKDILRTNGRIWKEYFIDEVETDGIKSRKITEYTS